MQKNKPKIILICNKLCNIIEIKYYTTFQDIENYVNTIYDLKQNQYSLNDIYGNNFKINFFNNNYQQYSNGVITNVMDKYYYNQPLNILIIKKDEKYEDYIVTQDNISTIQTTVCIYNISACNCNNILLIYVKINNRNIQKDMQ